MSTRLAAHLPDPFVEVHPQDADSAGLTEGGWARVATAHGACVVKVVVSENQRPGSLFVPIHWSAETASDCCVGDLVSPHTDAHSGQPESKATPAAITPVSFSLRGFARTRCSMFPSGTWWARVAVADGAEYRLATSQGLMVWHDFAHRVLKGEARLAEQIDGHIYRAAAFIEGEMDRCLCIGPIDAPLHWDARVLSAADVADGAPLQTCKASEFVGEAEPVICACLGVGVDVVRNAINSGAAKTVADIGAILRAGTNCGSCLPELKRMIVHERIAQSS
jgi:assimilatory nitrate reductase catalytic subunit